MLSELLFASSILLSLLFSVWQIYCFRLITPSGTRTTSSTYAPLLSFESREKRTSLCQLILQIQEKAFDYSSWVIRAPPLDNGLPQTVKTVYNAGYVGSILGLGRFPGGGNGNPFQYSCLENPDGQREPGRLQSMGSQRVGHDLATKQQSWPK